MKFILAKIKHLNNFLKRWIYAKRHPVLNKYTEEYLEYFGHLFSRAATTSGFNYLCTVLRVEGITSGHWDAFVEAEEAAMDFSKLLRKMGKGQEKRALRMGLFLYSHSTEMSAPYEIIANLLRSCQDKPYKMYPFAHLVQVEKGKTPSIFAKRHLPTPVKKIKHIKELAVACGEERIGEIFNAFFHNDIRNAFYHSDYAISDEEFRIIEGGEIGKQSIKLEELSDFLSRCFAFYSAFFITFNQVRRGLVVGKKFLRKPNYEVLELLSDEDGLTGFKIHFPNGSYAMFERKKYEGTTGLNLMCLEEGIQLNVGDLKKYNEADGWYVNGKPFEEFGTRYNRIGFWFPIIFSRNSDVIQKKAREATKDRAVQGCLFYIYATGHKAIEFVIKSKSDIRQKENLLKRLLEKDSKKLVFENIPNNTNNYFLYDGTFYLENDNPESIKNALNYIESYIKELKRKFGDDIYYRLKYQMYSDGSAGKKEKTGENTFSITLSMDDPRTTLVASNLELFPKADWKIKEEWV